MFAVLSPLKGEFMRVKAFITLVGAALLVSSTGAHAQTAVMPSPGVALGGGALLYKGAKACLKHKVACAIAGGTAAYLGHKGLTKNRRKARQDDDCPTGYGRIFRVVSLPEADQIIRTGSYKVGVNSYEGKQFWTRMEDALWFNDMTHDYPDARPGRKLVTSLTCNDNIVVAFKHADGPSDRVALTFDMPLLERANADAKKKEGIKIVRNLPWRK